MQLTVTLMVALTASALAPAQTPSSSTPGTTAAAGPRVRHVIGLDTIKRNTIGALTVQDGALEFKAGKTESKVPVSAIDDIFIGTETTQSGGKAGTVIKTAAIAAPYASGKALTILMRTKVDILTVSFHSAEGALHGAIFALPIGQAEQMRAQLIQAGAHTRTAEKQASGRSAP